MFRYTPKDFNFSWFTAEVSLTPNTASLMDDQWAIFTSMAVETIDFMTFNALKELEFSSREAQEY